MNCRSCTGTLREFLSLGSTPLANALLTRESLSRPEPRFPLRVGLCEGCHLVQLLDTVPPEDLFSDYLYFSSFSNAMTQHARLLAEQLTASRQLGAQSRVVEIASNDGYLLQWYLKASVPVVGVEPARNIAAEAERRGVPTRVAFFGLQEALAMVEEGLTADVIHANNVLAHVPDVNSFAAGVAALLKPTGVAVIEVPYVVDLVKHVEFDTIYHEHVFYFGLHPLVALFRRHGLNVEDVELLPIHGGSLRLWVGRGEVGRRTTALLERERAEGVTSFSFYEDFASRVTSLKGELVGLLRDLASKGKSVVAYGASAKGSTLLNTFGIGADLLQYVVDRSTYKQGRFMPGVKLEIFPPERLLETRPDYALLLTWNFKDEILAQQKQYLTLGGRFILPVPKPVIL